MTRYATILGTGRYVPERIVTNEEFKEVMGAVSPKLPEVVDKFEASSNIKLRRYAPEDWVTSDIRRGSGQGCFERCRHQGRRFGYGSGRHG